MPGTCTLFKGDADEHSEYAIQMCNERLLMVQHKKDGRDIYSWKSREPHDVLDATAQAFAVAASQGISGSVLRKAIPARAPSRRSKPKIKLI